ncbi:MAG TPA: hypothetical protein VLX28_19485 [Thermoanaerobaculia bacterium]|nr:hypothetical protein [Thermoanaerobaculia bacterium]
MSNRKLFAMFALGTAFALTAALPAAADREDKAPRNPGRHVVAPAPTAQPSFGTSNPRKTAVHWQRVPQTPGGPSFMLKSYCEGTCADGTTFWCEGASSSCTDGDGCTASGGGVKVTVSCDI